MQNDETCNHSHAHIPWGWFQSQLQWAKQGKGKALSDSRLAGFQQQCEKHKCTSSQPLFEVKNKFYLRYVVPEKSLPPSLGPIMSPSPFHCGARHLPGTDAGQSWLPSRPQASSFATKTRRPAPASRWMVL